MAETCIETMPVDQLWSPHLPLYMSILLKFGSEARLHSVFSEAFQGICIFACICGFAFLVRCTTFRELTREMDWGNTHGH